MDLKKYDIKRFSIAFSPVWILFVFIFGLVLYGWAIGDTLIFLFFGFTALFILIPFLIPIANIFLLFKLEEFHDFIGVLIGSSGDANTLSLISFIAVVYVLLSVFIVVMTILAIIVIYWDRLESQLFAGLTPFIKRQKTGLEKKS